uniref:Predicted protein n=1 Tax=Hordeum vulgare subsp. vulgare TaxID=112509 RepID=F2DYV0_HORVV|nr:predicted protein [Hordeum vulgare subsp. vulgare]
MESSSARRSFTSRLLVLGPPLLPQPGVLGLGRAWPPACAEGLSYCMWWHQA